MENRKINRGIKNAEFKWKKNLGKSNNIERHASRRKIHPDCN